MVELMFEKEIEDNEISSAMMDDQKQLYFECIKIMKTSR